MKPTQILWLSEKEVSELLTVSDALPLVEEAFGLLSQGRAQMPPKIYLDFKEFHGDLRAMPAYLPGLSVAGGRSFAGVKVVNSHPENPSRGLPTVSAVLVLNDPETGLPLAMMAAGRLTDIRTGAAGGVAAKYMARRDSRVVGLVGCGRQALTQWEALRGLFPIEEVRVSGATHAEADQFCRRQIDPGPRWRAVSVDEAAHADIVVTTTPGRTIVVKASDVRPGTHINAIGADAPGKQELEIEVLRGARVVVDSPTQAFHSGEVNVGLATGHLSPTDIVGSLGDVVTGKIKARRSESDITVFDSTGLAVQDVAVAAALYLKAITLKRGTFLSL